MGVIRCGPVDNDQARQLNRAPPNDRASPPVACNPLNHRHAIDFDVERAGERGHVQEDARWRLVWEIARVTVVEDGEVRWLWPHRIKEIQAAVARELAARSEVPKTMPQRIAALLRELHRRLRNPNEEAAPRFDLDGAHHEGSSRTKFLP